jgi:hypothetical protein
MTRTPFTARALAVATALIGSLHVGTARSWADSTLGNQVLEWNQIFIDTLVATNTPNSSSQRLGAIVHTAIFDAFNGIDRHYTSVFVEVRAPRRFASGGVIAAAHGPRRGCFPSQGPLLDTRYECLWHAAQRCHRRGTARAPDVCLDRIDLGVSWGMEVAQAVLAWRATDGFSATYPPFTGGAAVGQWRPTPPAFGPMSAQGLAFTSMFVVPNNTLFQPQPPRPLGSATYADDVNAVKALGRRTGSTRTEDQSALAVFWEGNASVHWNQAANRWHAPTI